MGASPSPSRAATAALLLAGSAAGLGLGEAGLRLAGFEYRTLPVVQFGWPEPKEIRKRYVPDVELLWVPRRYAERLAQARAMRRPVVFLGDSCTEFGTYPEQALKVLHSRRPMAPRGVKLGVGGWSSEQGLRQLRRDVLPLAPSVVTLYFGWNDHWVALGPPDREVRPSRALLWITHYSRVAQLVAKASLAVSAPAPATRPNRVSLSDYRANLTEMVRLAHAHGAQAVLITAPSSHEIGKEPAYLLRRHVRSLAELVPMHQAYLGATREVARETGAVLCDAAAEFAARPETRTHFMADGIHMHPRGHRVLGEILAGCLERALDSLPAGADPARTSGDG